MKEQERRKALSSTLCMVPSTALHTQASIGASGVMAKGGEKGFCCRGMARGAEVRGLLAHMTSPR